LGWWPENLPASQNTPQITSIEALNRSSRFSVDLGLNQQIDRQSVRVKMM
jgi:hypothetical protein